MCAKHVAERPRRRASTRTRPTTRPVTRSRTRARARGRALATAAVLVTAWGFLTWLANYDDGAEARAQTQARASVALASWQPGEEHGPVLQELNALAGSGIPDAESLRTLIADWDESPSVPDTAALTEAVAAAGDQIAAELRSAHRTSAALLAAVLLVVAGGWLVWFRRSVRLQREVQRGVTERTVVDEGERRLLALVRNSTDVVAVIDPDSTATFLSPAVAVLGWEPDELTGRALLEIVSPQDQTMLARLLTGSSGDVHSLQIRMRHRDGRELVMEGSLVNLCDDSAVRGWVLTVRDITERKRLQEDLTTQAFHDSLTGLANRQLFFDRLDHALTRREPQPWRPLAVLSLDLDDFKDVNDSLGHASGDVVLLTVAQRLAAAIRDEDTAARLGGDEFAVLMEDTDLPTATQVAHRLLGTLAAPVEIDGQLHVVRASIGLAEAVPGRSNGTDTMRNADVAVDMAKERGKSSLAIYDPAWHRHAVQSFTVRQELEIAIATDQLTLVYQPIVTLEDYGVTGFEALVRWDHPERGLLTPEAFIPLAEQSGLIVPLDNWVLRAAVHGCAYLQTADHRPSISVNVSAKQLSQPGFDDIVLSTLTEAGLPADRLVLEVTESALVDELDVGVKALVQLRSQGVRVAIDDFGTGYTSLSQLARLPVDQLKVDKSFIEALRHGQDGTLVSTFLATAQGMRLLTVAEGVEDAQQAAWLHLAGCDLGQGYLWSRPVDLDAARDLPHALPHARSGSAREAEVPAGV
ncbi:GGDEF domain-containing phosphodiesterase [uncultured Nocardioides sp.]|uniref:putative bifunctional diguanylate cyclase/phosphodiesterase n=1 Tax=uncultured Nocardioides sp. TaxID=198441 RepID=UPI00263272FC|nr:GGDEF domain-containing phosphodiesterase [uncultured Nocardioides sp.]HRD63544.1 EAL domain-containing protein [Nocardioides sp.]